MQTAASAQDGPLAAPAATPAPPVVLAVLSSLALSACGGGSSPASPTPTPTPSAPQAPTGLSAAAGDGQVVLSWSPSAGAVSYAIQRATASAGPFASAGTAASAGYTDTLVTNGTTYYYTVAAVNGSGSSANSAIVSATPATLGTPLSRAQAARILAQGAFGGSDADIQNLMSSGLNGWLTQQFALSPSESNVAWLQAQGLNVDGPDRDGVQSSFWRKLISSPDVLRQRIMLALTDFIVVSTEAITLNYRGMAAAYFLDQLEANAFGNYRDILLAVSHTPAMGQYLTFLNSVKANPTTGTMPDENYAREVMQLFSIGIVDLNLDGTPIPGSPGSAVAEATYSQTDVLNMARVFTGWQLDTSAGTAGGAAVIRPMINNPAGSDTGSKVVLGTTIAANLDGEQNLTQAIAILMAHPNMAPFISRQLIQRLVTSNPSPDYVYRVASVFAGTQGDMKAVITATLSDVEATSDANLDNPQTGKLREPVVRFVQWARTFGLTLTDTQWANIGNLSSQANALAESPLQAPNVFFFFQPGYSPPNTALAAANITAPEFGLTNETSVAGYMNFMQNRIAQGIPTVNGVAGAAADYSALTPLVNSGGNSAALLAELNLLLAAGQISATTLSSLQTALDTIDVSSTAGQNNRLYAALTLVMSAPEYLVQK